MKTPMMVSSTPVGNITACSVLKFDSSSKYTPPPRIATYGCNDNSNHIPTEGTPHQRMGKLAPQGMHVRRQTSAMVILCVRTVMKKH